MALFASVQANYLTFFVMFGFNYSIYLGIIKITLLGIPEAPELVLGYMQQHPYIVNPN